MRKEIKVRAYYRPEGMWYDHNGVLASGRPNPLMSDRDWRVMQFTGLLDKNGKEIYEGDVLKVFNNINKLSDPNLSGAEPTYTEVSIEFIRGGYFASCDRFPDGGHGNLATQGKLRSKFIEVIGNIYQHPGLRKLQ